MLEGPNEFKDWKDGETMTLRVIKWIKDEGVIRPPRNPRGEVVPVLRVFVPEEDKPLFPHYWDLTAKTLMAQLEPILRAPGFERRVFVVTAHGEGPQKRFSVEVR